MNESMTVTVGLDVHARSIRLAAVRADELLEERTLPYDPEAVERLLRPAEPEPDLWPPRYRVAGPPTDAQYAALRDAGEVFLRSSSSMPANGPGVGPW